MRRIISFLLIFAALAANARQISPEEAKAIAAEFFNSDSSKTLNKTPYKAISTDAKVSADYQPYYVFNASDYAGFVIISGDTRVKKIIGYSDKGSFDADNVPPQLSWLLNKIERQISQQTESNPQDDTGQNEDDGIVNNGNDVVLETANWGQGYPYNAKCPIINGTQALTGCVATAMAIVMKYHNWPEVGKHENYCSFSDNGTVYSYNFSQYHPEWLEMKQNYDESDENIDAVSNLMYAAGISSATNYEEYSGATINDALMGLKRFFSYDRSMSLIQDFMMTKDEWISTIHYNIDNGMPLLYTASESSTWIGHCFVVDGYTKDSDFIHVNWGWDGHENGFYSVELLTPAGYNFDMDFNMIAGIKPMIEEDTKWSDFYMSPNTIYDYVREINISVENVIAEEEFDCSIPRILTPPHVMSDYGLALINDQETIKEIVLNGRYPNSNEIGRSGTIGINFERVKFSTQISDSDRLQLVVREADETTWKFVNPIYGKPSSISVRGNNPVFSDITWDIDPRLHIMFQRSNGETLYEKLPHEGLDAYLNKILHGMGLVCLINQEESDGIKMNAAVRVNGMMRGNHLYDTNKPGRNFLDFGIGGEHDLIRSFDVQVMACSSDYEKSATIIVKDSTDVADFIKANDCTHITSLKLAGKGYSYSELRLIYNNMPFLETLDLSEYEPEGRILRPWLFSDADDDKYFTRDILLERPGVHVRPVSLTRLRNVILPSELDSIKAGVFMDCNIDNIVIPESVKYIGFSAFDYLNDGYREPGHISSVFCKALIPPHLGDDGYGNLDTFGNQTQTTLYVMPGCKEIYRQHPYWGSFKEIIEDENPILGSTMVVKNGVRYKLLRDYAQVDGYEDNCPKVVSLENVIDFEEKEMPVKSMKYKAFSGCKIEKITIPSNIVNWESDCFFSSECLEEVVIESPIKILPAHTFEWCSNLKKLKLPETLEVIEEYALSDVRLTEFEVTVSLKEIEHNGIIKVPTLKKIVLPKENTNFKLVDGVLYSADMKSLCLYPSAADDGVSIFEIPQGVTQISRNAIYGGNLQEVIVPESLTTLEFECIYGGDLKTVRLPENITYIPYRAFPLPKYFAIGRNVEKFEQLAVGRVEQHEVNLYCLNEKLLRNFMPVEGWYEDNEYNQHTLNFYSAKFEPNISLDVNRIDYENLKQMRMYVPGLAKWKDANFLESNLHEMWDYKISRKQQLLQVWPLIDNITINKVYINGQIVPVQYGCYYELPESDAYDVEVCYTLHDFQSMTTRYDSEFNAKLTDSEFPECVGISNIQVQPDEIIGEPDNDCQLTAIVLPENATYKKIVWSSDNEEVASIDQNGFMRLKKLGVATIYATATDGSGVFGQCNVIVNDNSGIDAVINDGDTHVKILSINGMLIYEGKYADANLANGIYIVVSPKGHFKHQIK